jgi:hypothetical protein
MTTLDAEYQVLPASPPCPFSACPNSSIPVGSRPLVGTIALCSLRVLDDTCPKRDDFRLDETVEREDGPVEWKGCSCWMCHPARCYKSIRLVQEFSALQTSRIAYSAVCPISNPTFLASVFIL